MKKIGVIGSRRRKGQNDYMATRSCVRVYFDRYQNEGGILLVSGGCPEGGDQFAERIAKAWGLPILIFYPNWTKYGKLAGIIRNSLIADFSEHIVACVADDREGGTEDTIKKFLRKIEMNENQAIATGNLLLA